MLKTKRQKRKLRIIDKNRGTSEKPRLSIYRSNKYIYAQLIDDDKGVTLAQAYGVDASKVGEKLAELGTKKKVSKIIFDRAGYKYHGRVKQVAEAARESGLVF